jgi:hypothetical protein
MRVSGRQTGCVSLDVPPIAISYRHPGIRGKRTGLATRKLNDRRLEARSCDTSLLRAGSPTAPSIVKSARPRPDAIGRNSARPPRSGS